MKVIFTIINTTWALVKIRHETIQVHNWFEPMASVVIVLCFTCTNWANKPTGSWLLRQFQWTHEVMNNPHQYCRGRGFQSCTGLNLFQALFSLLLITAKIWDIDQMKPLSASVVLSLFTPSFRRSTTSSGRTIKYLHYGFKRWRCHCKLA